MRQVFYVARDPHGVAVRRRITLVDDVREGLEGGRHLVAEADNACVQALDEQQQRDECDREPELAQHGEREHDAEPDARCGGEQVRKSGVLRRNTLEQGPHSDVDEPRHGGR